MNAQPQITERRAEGEDRSPVILTKQQRETLQDQLYLLDSITNQVIMSQGEEKPILAVLDILAEHRERITKVARESR